MKFKLPWLIPPEFVVQFVTPSVLVFHENHNKECPLNKFEPFSKCGFVNSSS